MLSKIFKNEPKFSEKQLQSIRESLQSRRLLHLEYLMYPCHELGLKYGRNLSATQIKQVAEIFKTNTTITMLTLKNFNLDSDTIAKLAKALEENHTLRTLNLYCDINDKGLNALAVMLKTNNTITQLFLRSSKRFVPSEDTINNIAAFFKINTSLVDIELPIEDFAKEQHFITFIEALKNNKNIINFFGVLSDTFKTNYFPQIQPICKQNLQESEAIINEFQHNIPAHFADIKEEMISKIAERKSALSYVLKSSSVTDHKLYHQFQKLITQSDNILISLSGYHLNPYRQLSIAKTCPPQQNEQAAGTNLLLALPLELQKHIFSYVPFRNIASPASTPMVSTISAPASIPTIDSPTSSPSFFSKLTSHIKQFFVNLFQCILSPFTTKNTHSPMTQPAMHLNQLPHPMTAPAKAHDIHSNVSTRLRKTNEEPIRSR